MTYRSALPDWQLNNKKIIVRCDLNVPLHETTILNDFRLQALRPTLDCILKKGGTIILITHIGRPKKPVTSLSTKQLIPWFQQYHYSIQHAATPTEVPLLTNNQHTSIILLENIRFFPEEKNNDPLFAQQLASLGDYYINDGFGIMHETSSSITLLPSLFPAEKKSFGLLVEHELNMLSPLIKKPKHPFILIIGGKKIIEKIEIIEYMLDKVDAILLCPAIVFSFNKALKKNIGLSLVDTNALDLCKRIIKKAYNQNIPLIFPKDYLVANNNLDGPLSMTTDDLILDHQIGVSIGPKTIDVFHHYIKKAQTIFFNGAIGFSDRPETLDGLKTLLTLIAHAPGLSIVTGGDTMATVFESHLEHQIDYLSTGGGATLAYMSGKKLPGLDPLINGTKTQ